MPRKALCKSYKWLRVLDPKLCKIHSDRLHFHWLSNDSSLLCHYFLVILERFQLWKRPICLGQQMHVDSFAKFSETLNCYIKKKNYEMKYRNNCKIFASTRGEFNNQLMYYNAFVMYYRSPLFLSGVACLQIYTF